MPIEDMSTEKHNYFGQHFHQKPPIYYVNPMFCYFKDYFLALKETQ
jgi:hypothetical protein